MRISCLQDYNQKLKNTKKVYQVIDINIEDNVILYIDIEDENIILFDFFDEMFVKDTVIIDNSKYDVYSVVGRYNTISRIFTQTFKKSDEYLEKAQFTEDYLKENLIDAEIIFYL